MIQTFANERSSEATIASTALTHAGVLDGLTVGQWHASVSPAEGAVGNPTALAISWSYPDIDAAALVLNLERPLGVEFDDVAVGNLVGAQWVHDQNVVFAQDQLWSHPEQVGESRHQYADAKIKHQGAGHWVPNALRNEKRVEHKGHNGPSQISLWSKNFNHASIIAGLTAVGIGK